MGKQKCFPGLKGSSSNRPKRLKRKNTSMVREAHDDISRYQLLLRRYYQSEKMIQWRRMAQELESLAKYVINASDESACKSFGRLVLKEFHPSSLVVSMSLESYEKFVTFYNGWHFKLEYLKSHISDEYLKASKLRYLSVVIDDLPAFLSDCCNDYVFNGRDCLYYGICISKCLKYYESSTKERTKLKEFDKELICRVKELVNRKELDFGKIYIIWKRTEDFLKVFNSNLLLESSPASYLFTTDKSLLITKSLRHYILSPETVFSVFDQEQCNNYYLDREFYWEQDFDVLLTKIILVDDFRCARLDRRPELRAKFQQSLPNVDEFHIELFNYMYDKFHANYIAIGRDSSRVLLNLEKKWINAFSTFLIYYLPALENFILLVVRKLLLPQILELGSTKFKKFYQHNSCLERHIFENLCRTVPNTILELSETIHWMLKSRAPAKMLNSNGPMIEELFMPRKNAEAFNLFPEKGPIWPDRSFKDHWNQQVRSYSSEGKSLHGCFSKHIVIMKLPLLYSSSERITLITNLSIASILNLYNDETTIAFNDICQMLNVTKLKESILKNGLRRLLDFGLIVLTKDNVYKFNYKFNNSNSSKKVIKLI